MGAQIEEKAMLTEIISTTEFRRYTLYRIESLNVSEDRIEQYMIASLGIRRSREGAINAAKHIGRAEDGWVLRSFPHDAGFNRTPIIEYVQHPDRNSGL